MSDGVNAFQCDSSHGTSACSYRKVLSRWLSVTSVLTPAKALGCTKKKTTMFAAMSSHVTTGFRRAREPARRGDDNDVDARGEQRHDDGVQRLLANGGADGRRAQRELHAKRRRERCFEPAQNADDRDHPGRNRAPGEYCTDLDG